MRADLSTPTRREQYQRDGYLDSLLVLEADEVRRYRTACDELEQRLGGRPRTVEVRQMHLHFRWAYELATHRRVLDAVENVLGPNLLIWATELFAKHPFDTSVSIGWHRDHAYMGFDAERTTTAWIALSDSTPDNGCMQVLIERDRRRQARAGATYARQETPDDALLINLNLRAGEMSLHDPYVLHGSGPNASAEKRVGFVVRFVAADARTQTGRPEAMLVRGAARRGNHFRLVDQPAELDADQALAALKKSAAQHLDSMLETMKKLKA